MGPKVGDIWAVRIFRDTSPELRVFKITDMSHNMSISFKDMQKPTGPDILYARSDIQFLDCLEDANEKGNAPPQGEQRNREPDSSAGGGGQPRHNASVRRERDR